MSSSPSHPRLTRFLSDYGMVFVLLLLCAYFSAVTLAQQQPGGASGGGALARDVVGRFGPGAKVVIVVGHGREDGPFADALAKGLQGAGATVLARVQGHPRDARRELQKIAEGANRPDVIVASPSAGRWVLHEQVGEKLPALGAVPVMRPQSYRWPDFLKADNLSNIANQIAVIAIIAIGMTMVVITGGIDLSVGSLIALSAVVATLLIRGLAGAENASAAGMALCCLAAIAVCGLVGLGSGTLVTAFNLPPFIVTLGTMLVASGLAFIVARGQSIYQVPDGFVWLGRGADLLGVPNAVLLMALLYVAAHVVMTRMTLGRYLYAVGGNAEAARLSGVPVRRVLLLAYALSGALAGLGGVVLASRLKSGAPTYGQMYELYVIAAVVVGGTSLQGGEGKVFGTLIGALLIAVIQNGMNLTGVESYTQKVVLGGVILGAVLLDRLKKRAWSLPMLFGRARKAPAPAPEAVGGRIHP
jgi:ribose transport system permease protein